MSDPRYAAMILFGILIAGCEANTEEEVGGTSEAPLSEELAQGRNIWEANCRVCHGPGLAGAPPKGDKEAWQTRIEKGLGTLVQHAREGYSGPGGHQMPARGGNPDLSDSQIAAAVAYMVSQSQ